VAVWILCLLLRRDGAHVRYWLWWSATVKFLVPFALFSAAGAWVAGPSASITVPEVWTARAGFVAEPFQTAPNSVEFTLLALWAIGSCVVLLHWLRRSLQLRRRLRAADRAETAPFQQQPGIEIRYTDRNIEPGIVGLFRPLLLLPRDIQSRLTPDRNCSITLSFPPACSMMPDFIGRKGAASVLITRSCFINRPIPA
jgi:beta-lactamase regulating signal transducer with metallopeptidase domain